MQSAILMQLFLVDLLGRNTIEAKIFSRGIDKEMKKVMVLPISLKVLAGVLMILLNFYFVYGSILYARGKSTDWQGKWLQVFCFNLFIDIMYTSVAEVFILRYLIPTAIANRAADIKEKLDLLSSKMSNLSNDNKTFSVTQWFFVSNHIAMKRPDIPEASIVLAYRSVSPNDISSKFNRLIEVENKKEAENIVRNRNESHNLIIAQTVLDITTLVLKGLTLMSLQIGVLPDFLQVLIVRLSQVILLLIYKHHV